MKIKVMGVDGLKTVEIEAEENETFATVAKRAGDALGYHGTFVLSEPSGSAYGPSGLMLGESAEFAERDWDQPLRIAQVQSA